MDIITPKPPGSDLQILHVRDEEDAYVVFATSTAPARCPGCNASSASRHGIHRRYLQDLPIQGLPVTLQVSVTRWRCPNPDCTRLTFTGRLAETARPFAKRTDRVAALARRIGHAVGGRPSERLLAALGLPQSDDSPLRSLKRGAAAQHGSRPVRVAGIDDWSRRKGMADGTIMVDLERRQVVDVLADRSAAGTAQWLRQHPETEIMSSDRCRLYARGARDGAPQARQVADRFHLLQNLREVIERQRGRAPLRGGATVSAAILSPPNAPPGAVIGRYPHPRVAEHRQRVRDGQRSALQARFDQVQMLRAAGKSIGTIAREAGCNGRTVAKWIAVEALPERRTMAPKPTTPDSVHAHLAQRWTEGCTDGRQLLAEIRLLGYAGSLTHLQRLLSRWRRAHFAAAAPAAGSDAAPAVATRMAPAISPIFAAVLCIKPRRQLTPRQAETDDTMKVTSADFAAMRQLAMQFRGILRGHDAGKLDGWLQDAAQSGIHGMRRYASTLRLDLAAVENAIRELWSNGQVDGQINRLKTLKRAMCGRAGIALLRARMLPLPVFRCIHRD